MPSRNQSGRPEHIHQNLNRARKKSRKRHEKAIKWYITLCKREEKEGSTKWIQNTKKQAEARIKKMGISQEQIAQVHGKATSK